MRKAAVPFPVACGRASRGDGRLLPLLWRLLLLVWLLPLTAFAQVPAALPATAPPRIGVMVMQPGEIFWERCGHDSVVVADPSTGETISYNFGFFDPGEPDFVSRFVRGDMRYRLAAVP